ncbi:hypothetical protein YC2023_010319 [Brassica napus]
MRLKPTKFICDYTTKELGIVRDVKKMWKNMGLGTLGYNPQPLYPDLVIQFLSSVELHYKSEVNKVASKGKLTFLCRGLLYEMSIHELCILFGFETRHEACSLPKFPCAYLLWSKIADSSYVSREAKLAMLRNPVLRVVAKYMGHLLLGKSEAGSLTEDEAQLIHYGLPLALRPTYDVADEPQAELSVNMGALFAQMLFERKFRGLRPLDRKPLDESIGRLLTRIFMHHDIDLSDTPYVSLLNVRRNGGFVVNDSLRLRRNIFLVKRRERIRRKRHVSLRPAATPPNSFDYLIAASSVSQPTDESRRKSLTKVWVQADGCSSDKGSDQILKGGSSSSEAVLYDHTSNKKNNIRTEEVAHQAGGESGYKRLASAIITPSRQSLPLEDNITIRDKNVALTLTFSPHATGNEIGNDQIIGALNDMEIMDPNADAMMEYDGQDDDYFGEDLMDVELQLDDVKGHHSSPEIINQKSSKGARSRAKSTAPLGIQGTKMGFLRRGSPRIRSVKSSGRSHTVENERQRRHESKRLRQNSTMDDGQMGSKNPSKRYP